MHNTHTHTHTHIYTHTYIISSTTVYIEEDLAKVEGVIKSKIFSKLFIDKNPTLGPRFRETRAPVKATATSSPHQIQEREVYRSSVSTPTQGGNRSRNINQDLEPTFPRNSYSGKNIKLNYVLSFITLVRELNLKAENVPILLITSPRFRETRTPVKTASATFSPS